MQFKNLYGTVIETHNLRLKNESISRIVFPVDRFWGIFGGLPLGCPSSEKLKKRRVAFLLQGMLSLHELSVRQLQQKLLFLRVKLPSPVWIVRQNCSQ